MVDDFTLAIATAPKKDSAQWKNKVVVWSDIKKWMDTPANKKESGNYVLGRLVKDGRRNNRTVEARSALTIDVDHPDDNFLERLEQEQYLHIWHTTHSSTPDNPRYRVIIPLDREINPAEYEAAVRGFMEILGSESGFDPSSIEYARYMFMPSSQKPAWFEWGEGIGPLADPDELIANAPESLAGLPPIRPSRRKQDPFQMAYPIGEFNRAYEDLDALIQEYELPYDSAGTKRWTLRGALRSAAGVGEVAPGLWYSHHGGDPAHGEAQTAFDLVRIHLFGELDEDVKPRTPVNKKPSHLAMKDLAMADPKVLEAKWKEPYEDFEDFDATRTTPTVDPPDNKPSEASEAPSDDKPADWRTGLATNRAGAVLDSLDNWKLILKHDPNFKAIVYNEMTRSTEVDGETTWRRDPSIRAWLESDLKNLQMWVEEKYHLRASKERVDLLVMRARSMRHVDPVKDYLVSLDGRWDGQARVEECLPGVTPDDFTRMAARKSLVAAVARAMQPGVKADHTLIIYGKAGLGKSEWIDRMSKGWTADLGDIRNKDTLVTLSRSWIVVADEGHSLRKADVDAQKAFLTRRVDVFRAPYERQVAEYPRRCVIWGTTNEDVFLTRDEGNRRYLPVHSTEKVDLDSLTPDYIDQLWAEAYHMWQNGELLYLTEDESTLAVQERERYTEDDTLAGQIASFLDMKVPEDWLKMGRDERHIFFRDYQQGADVGTESIQMTCVLQVWHEVMGEQYSPTEANRRMIRASMKNVAGWRPGDKTKYFDKSYGSQRVYERFDLAAELEEIL